MNVLKYISDKKHEFTKAKIKKETTALKDERIRQGEIAKLNAERARLQRDNANIQQFNQKVESQRQPSSVEKLGRGLAGFMNKSKQKSSGKAKKSSFGGFNSNKLASLNQGSKGIDFGGRGLDFGPTRVSPMNEGPKKRKESIF